MAGFDRYRTLEDVIRGGCAIVEVIVQDEYCHDVVATAPHVPGFVVFDTT